MTQTSVVPSTRIDEFPALEHVTYLNSGSAGPLSRAAANALSAALQEEFTQGRADAASWKAFLDSRGDLRAALAELVGCATSEVALTHHTTEGLNIALWGLDWVPGDRIAVTSLEHEAGVAAVNTLATRCGLTVDVADVGLGGVAETLIGVEEAMRRHPRMLLVSHVAYSTGAVLPLREIAEIAHAHECLVVVDGAQAVGAIEVNVAHLDVDVYSFNGYKWLCGPEGSGGLVVRERLHELIRPSHGGAFGVSFAAARLGDPASTPPLPGAERYESGSWFRPQLRGLRAAVDWYRGRVAEGGGPRHISTIAAHAAHRLAREIGAIIHTPDGPQRSGLVAFSLPDRDPHAVVAQLESVGVIIRSIPGSGHLRVSCAAFTTEEDITALIAALSAPSGQSPV